MSAACMASGALAISLAIVGLSGCGTGDPPMPASVVTVTATVQVPPSEIERPQPTSRPTSARTPTATATEGRTQVRGSTVEGGGTASFQHFDVTVQQVRHGGDVQVRAEICVRSLPPDPQGNRTRISWDPWSVWTGSKSVAAARSGVALKGGLPVERIYRVGECASGWIPFPTTTKPVRINYKNGVGDIAVWDASHPEDQPRTSQAQNDHTDEDVVYDNCSAVRAAGKAPIRRGDPGYGPHLDGDDDGIGCER